MILIMFKVICSLHMSIVKLNYFSIESIAVRTQHITHISRIIMQSPGSLVTTSIIIDSKVIVK